MEEHSEVKVYQINYKCPKCETGYLEGSGYVLTSYPPTYPHKCNNDSCDYSESFRGKSYPYIEYKKINT